HVSDSKSEWLPSAAGKQSCGSPGTSWKGYARQSADCGLSTAPAFFAMFAAIATLAVWTGGDAVMGEIKRFPFDAYPKGWFQVAYSREVAHGRVLGLHYFGRRLICYRGDSGNPYVLDAYCPHLGADIAVGGTVADDCIICPFHGWRFDGSGSNVEIPYANTVNRTARLRSWPTAER